MEVLEDERCYDPCAESEDEESEDGDCAFMSESDDAEDDAVDELKALESVDKSILDDTLPMSAGAEASSSSASASKSAALCDQRGDTPYPFKVVDMTHSHV